jgi:hypothetical protein
MEVGAPSDLKMPLRGATAGAWTEKVHGRARAPSRQTRGVAAKEVRSRVAPRKAAGIFFIVSNGNF